MLDTYIFFCYVFLLVGIKMLLKMPMLTKINGALAYIILSCKMTNIGNCFHNNRINIFTFQLQNEKNIPLL